MDANFLLTACIFFGFCLIEYMYMVGTVLRFASDYAIKNGKTKASRFARLSGYYMTKVHLNSPIAVCISLKILWHLWFLQLISIAVFIVLHVLVEVGSLPLLNKTVIKVAVIASRYALFVFVLFHIHGVIERRICKKMTDKERIKKYGTKQ